MTMTPYNVEQSKQFIAIYPTSSRAWAMTILLMLANILSFVDRSILGLLSEPIKADLGLKDDSLGLLMGPAFALFYVSMGLPLGWLADRQRRTWIVSAGIAVWSLATAASGIARNFIELFLARMGVGVGEATLSPCAMSMIGDSFSPEKRGKPVAFYSMGLALGSGLASLIGAAVLVWAKTSDGTILPVVGAVAPWQFVFFILGIPGIILALAFLCLAEPPRQKDSNGDAAKPGSLRETTRTILADKAAFIGITSMVCVMAITAYSHGFMPSAFARSYGWEPQQFAFANGLSTLLVGPASLAVIGWQIDRMRARGVQDAPIRILIAGFIALIPTSAAILFMPTAWSALALNAINTVPFAMVTAAGIICLLDIAPVKVRAQTVALYYMAISITGLGLGPTTAGYLSTYVFGEAHLNWAVSAIPIIFGILPLLCVPMIRRAYLAKLAQVQTPQNDSIFA